MNQARSRGSYLLLRSGQSQKDIARKLGVDQSLVSLWVSGKRKPGGSNRRILRDKFGVPSDAWDEDQAADSVPQQPPVVSSKPLIPLDNQSQTVQERIASLERLVGDLSQQVESDQEMTPLERGKVMASISTTLHQLARLKGETVSEVKVVKHPKWLELRTAILEALEPFPDALDAVLSSLEQRELDRL